MRVHAVQHVSFEGPGWIADWAEARGHELSVINVADGELVPGPTESDFLIILGGPMSINDWKTIPWMREEVQQVADFLSANKPTLGICLGAQMLARVLGAKVRANVHPEIGWYDVHLKRESVKTFHWHSEVFTMPKDAVKIASSEITPLQGFRHGHRTMGIQFHPEMNMECIESMIENCGDKIEAGKPGQQSIAEILAQAPEACQGHRPLLYRILDTLTKV